MCMQMKYTEIDLANATREQVQAEIARMTALSNEWKNEEQAVKLVINGMYGALGNKWLAYFNPVVAETVTLQGQDLIKFAERVMNAYFNKFWHLDKELHEKLGLTEVKEVKRPVNIYSDTDSVAADSQIMDKNLGKISIEEFWHTYAKMFGYSKDLRDNEIVLLDENIVQAENWDNDVKWSSVKRIIRHRVTKQKYRIETEGGKSVVITNDHSCVVIRDGHRIKLKPAEINVETDMVVCIYENQTIRTFKLEKIKSVEPIGEFIDEYVYDLEMYEDPKSKNDTHTFVANDILVHNSCYISFEEVIQSCDWQGKFDSPKDLIIAINKNRISEYLNKQFDRYAEKFGTANFQDFELETISESGIWLAKKKYILNKRWEDGIDIPTLTEIMYKGIELAQSSTPQFARTKLDWLMRYILEKKRDLSKRELTQLLRKIKEEFRMADPNDVSMGRSVNDYAKYIRNDSTGFEVADKTPIHVRAAGYHNYLLNQNADMKRKYEMLKGGNKVKFYYVKVSNDRENNVFAYTPGNYPYEFAPPIDYDLMFEKSILDPINRVMVAFGMGEIPPGLQIVTSVLDF